MLFLIEVAYFDVANLILNCSNVNEEFGQDFIKFPFFQVKDPFERKLTEVAYLLLLIKTSFLLARNSKRREDCRCSVPTLLSLTG